MPISVNIRISSTPFVKGFTVYGSSICFGGFCLPPVTPYTPCSKELTSRRTRWEYSVVISVLSVRKVQRKELVLVGDWLHSHKVQMVLLAITFQYYLKELRMYRPICCISLTLDGVSPCLIAQITLLFGQLNLRKDFLGGTKRSLLLRRSSNCNKSPNSFSNFFRKCFFVVWDFSVAPIDHM